MFEFLIRLGSITSELSRLLTIRFAPGSSGNETQLGKQVASLVPLWNSGQRQECELELLKLAFLVKHLKEIEAADQSLLLHFRREFRRSGRSLSYYGIRFEAHIAASLIRSDISFTKSETPDFLIDGNDIGLECTSTRIISNTPKKDLTYKVESAIKKKAGTLSNTRRPHSSLTSQTSLIMQ